MGIKLIVMDKTEIDSILEHRTGGGSDTDDGSGTTKDDSLVPFAIQATFYKYKVRKAASFHSLNSRAKGAAMAYEKVLGPDGISVHNVDGAMNASLRQETLEDAKRSNRSIITNCRLLGEGVDEPGWDLVVMADGTTSPVDSRQRIGGVSRKAPGKECGYVL